jgi:hypothetical protein
LANPLPAEDICQSNENSVRHATWSKRYETDFERLARDIAFEAGAEIEVRETEVVVVIAGAKEHLCTAEVPKKLWWSIWRAMCERFPVRARHK